MGIGETMEKVDPSFFWIGCPQFHSLDIIVSFDFFDMYFVCGIGDELHDCFDKELVWVVLLGCGG